MMDDLDRHIFVMPQSQVAGAFHAFSLMNLKLFIGLFLVCSVFTGRTAFARGGLNILDYAGNWESRESSALPKQSGGVWRFSCRQTPGGSSRSSWDLPVNLNLRSARGLRLHLQTYNLDPGVSFTFYLKSGAGWYTLEFSPDGSGKPETLDLLKSTANIEGQPQGWGGIEALRLAVWHGEQREVNLDLSAITPLPAHPRIALLRAVPGQAANERLAVNYTRNVCDALAESGIYPAVLDLPDLTAESLSPYSLLLLPFSPELPRNSITLLLAHLQRGGRLLTFFSQPAQILEAIGVRLDRYLPAAGVPAGFVHIVFPGRQPVGIPGSVLQESWNIHALRPVPGKSRAVVNWHGRDGRDTGEPAVIISPNGAAVSHVYLGQDNENGPQMLLALAAHLQPDLWSVAAAHKLPTAGVPPGFGSVSEARAYIKRQRPPGAIQALAYLNRSEQLAVQARARQRAGDSRGAVLDCIAADRAAFEVFYYSRSPLPGEFRGIWSHRAAGIPGIPWDRSIPFLTAAGFNFILPNIAWADKAYYPSKVLSPAADLSQNRDLLQECLTACKQHGMALHAWKICFKMSGNLSPEQLRKLESQGRLQQSFSGTVDRTWLCPGNQENQRLELAALEEIARNYPGLAGIHLDYVRYAGENFCFCNTCRGAFETFLGRRLTDWPREVRSTSQLRTQWRQFRQAQITGFVSTVNWRLKKIRPELRLSAAVFPNSIPEMDKIGQDWVKWCGNGELDFVVPMSYFQSTAEFSRVLHDQQQRLRQSRTPLLPGIGLDARKLSPFQAITQIEAGRRRQTRGFVLFEFSTRTSQMIPHLSKGLLRPPD